ncbi:MAG: cytochrome c3 family protein [bacterium]
MRRLFLVLAVLMLPAAVYAQNIAPFPHAKHARLFPVCSSCHVGVATADLARTFPPPALCATCHDGTIQRRVQWAAPTSRGAGLLVFSHQVHASRAKDVVCESCHATDDAKLWMNVARAAPVRCSACHAHGATAHLDERNVCATCHRTLVKAVALTDARIADFPKPPSHGREDFASTHGALARTSAASCATCHARESCQRCHVDGAREPVILALGSDARVARLVSGKPGSYPRPADHSRTGFANAHGSDARAGTARCATCHARESCERCHVDGARDPVIRALGTDARLVGMAAGKMAVYPTPADHRAPRFALVHGTAARVNIARCAVCHARASCESCHTGEGAQEILRHLPGAGEATAPGVQLRRAWTEQPVEMALASIAVAHTVAPPMSQAPRVDTTIHVVRVHPAGFAKSHGPVAASGVQQCASCHAQRLCQSCHSGERVTRRYHVANFVSTHAPQAYSRETECSSCHSTEAFCRDCHRQTGLAAVNNTRSTVFHNAQPLWLLQHGRAARQDLKSCTTCHQQTYCMQCHSDLGSRISPHGSQFDAARMSGKNPALCLYCHLTNPLKR